MFVVDSRDNQLAFMPLAMRSPISLSIYNICPGQPGGLQSLTAVVGIAKSKVQSDRNDGAKGLGPSRSYNIGP